MPDPDVHVDVEEVGVYDLENEVCATGYLVIARFLLNDNFTYVIHGTFASGSAWWRRTGNFAQAFERHHPGVWRCGNVEVTEYAWTGANAHDDRVEGGRLLAQHIRNLEQHKSHNEVSYAGIDLIAHSHGGNVVLEALKILAEEGISVNHVVLIATPQVRLKYQAPRIALPWQDRRVWFDWLYFQREVFDAVTGRFYNIFSPEDAVQTFWADFRDGVSRRQIPNNRFFKQLYCDRTYTGPGSGNLINIRQNTDVGSLDAHGVLHNTVMGAAIGLLLEGTGWTSAQTQAGVPAIIIDDDDKGD